MSKCGRTVSPSRTLNVASVANVGRGSSEKVTQWIGGIVGNVKLKWRIEMFEQGQKLRAVWHGEGADFNGYATDQLTSSNYGADSITVEMQAGQMALVPWAKVIRGDRTIMVNLALCNEVELLEMED